MSLSLILIHVLFIVVCVAASYIAGWVRGATVGMQFEREQNMTRKPGDRR